MKRTLRMKTCATRLALLLGALACAVAIRIEADEIAADHGVSSAVQDLRVFYVRPRVFEYLFTGGSRVGTNDLVAPPLLFFRDLAGNNLTVRGYERLGSYAVVGYTQRMARVFKDSVHAYLDQDASAVTLRDAGGSNRVLTVDQPLVEPGLMACFVSATSGGWGYLRCGDTVEIGGANVTVIELNTTSATIRADTREVPVPMATDAERKAVLTLWDARQRESEAQTARALARAEEKRQQAADTAASEAAARMLTRQTPAAETQDFNTGYGGCYPSQFDTVPYPDIWPNGRVYTQGILVPTYFGRRPDRHDHDGHDPDSHDREGHDHGRH